MEIIHIVLGKANPDRLNGVNKVVYHLATEQVKAGYNVKVWGITSDLTHNYPKRNFETVLFKASKFSFFVDKALKQAIVKNRQSVFHIHGGWIPQFSSLAKIFTKHKIKFVLTPHGAYNTVAMKRSRFKKWLYFSLFEKNLLKNAYKIHAIGQSEIIGLNNFFPNNKSFLMPYGFDTDVTYNKQPKNDVFTIGFVGRLDTYTKGLDLIMQAFKQFQQQYPKTALWIIGDGEGMPYLKNFVAKENINSVILWGKKFGQEKDTLISKMHIFLHPSRNEGLPTAALEAAAMGVPVIVSRATNLADYVSKFEAGIAVADEQVKELLSAILQLYFAYKNLQTQKYVDGANKMLKEVFAWPILVNKYNELYN